MLPGISWPDRARAGPERIDRSQVGSGGHCGTPREPVCHVPGPGLAVRTLAARLPARRTWAAGIALAQRDVLGL
jgi:hypothetical protein